MISRKERLYCLIFDKALEIFGDSFFEDNREFKKFVKDSCMKYSINEEEFWEWLSEILYKCIREYLAGSGYIV